ncbi:MAG: hypothetical protein RL120_00365 [Gammaproteobacteria bacterium]
MATITLNQETSSSVTAIEVVGPIQVGELGEFARQLDFHSLGSLCLWDFSAATWAGVPSERLIAGFDSLKSLVPRHQRIALLFGSTTDFGVGRMLQGKAEFEELGNEIGVFLDGNAARDWLLEAADKNSWNLR